MTKKELFFLILTFIVGICAGMYTYVTFFKPEFDKDTVPREERVARVFSVIGDQYGGCATDCPSFRILADGTLEYKATLENDVIKADIPDRIYTNIEAAVKNADLKGASESTSKSACPSAATGGLGYRYTVTYLDAIHELDSCATVFGINSPLGMALSDVWYFIENDL